MMNKLKLTLVMVLCAISLVGFSSLISKIGLGVSSRTDVIYIGPNLQVKDYIEVNGTLTTSGNEDDFKKKQHTRASLNPNMGAGYPCIDAYAFNSKETEILYRVIILNKFPAFHVNKLIQKGNESVEVLYVPDRYIGLSIFLLVIASVLFILSVIAAVDGFQSYKIEKKTKKMDNEKEEVKTSLSDDDIINSGFQRRLSKAGIESQRDRDKST